MTHLAKAISVQDLLEQVSARCPPGTEIPSKQWLRHQFWPKTPSNKNSLQYTGKLNIKFMIQARQLPREPNYPVAAVERGKKVVVAASGSTFTVKAGL